MERASYPRMIAMARLGYAAAALFTPKLATVMIGARPSQLTPAALAWASAFATREAAVGAVTLATEHCDPSARRKVLLMNAAVDAVDTLSLLALAKHSRSVLPLLTGAPAAAVSALIHIQAARETTAPGAPSPYQSAYSPG